MSGKIQKSSAKVLEKALEKKEKVLEKNGKEIPSFEPFFTEREWREMEEEAKVNAGEKNYCFGCCGCIAPQDTDVSGNIMEDISHIGFCKWQAYFVSQEDTDEYWECGLYSCK